METRSRSKQTDNSTLSSNSNSPKQPTSKRPKSSAPSGMLSSLVHNTLGPIFLFIFAPNLTMVLWFCVARCHGSFLEVGQYFREKQGLCQGLADIWRTTPMASTFSLAVIGGYMLWALILMIVLPGRRAEGPITPKGNLPVYKDNGFFCYVLTMLAFVGLTVYLKQHGMSPTIVHDRFNEILITLNLFSALFCIVLYLKGIFAPSTTDCSYTGNPFFDYYWGTELYPRIFGIDVKVFTNCRFGMTVWGLAVAIFWLKNYETVGFHDGATATAILQLLYITKFFWWEAGYYNTLDIILDRAGFYICWGCLVYITGLYTSVSYYTSMLTEPVGTVHTGAFLVFGLVSLAVNYLADKQKQDVRQSKGQCKVWGQSAQLIRAKYRLENRQERESLLLVNGWWGLSRHFHYIPELSLAFSWSAVGGFKHLMPFSYFIFLVILLVHRSFRDEEKCSKKYGKYWEEYKRAVPYRIVPYLF